MNQMRDRKQIMDDYYENVEDDQLIQDIKDAGLLPESE